MKNEFQREKESNLPTYLEIKVELISSTDVVSSVLIFNQRLKIPLKNSPLLNKLIKKLGLMGSSACFIILKKYSVSDFI